MTAFKHVYQSEVLHQSQKHLESKNPVTTNGVVTTGINGINGSKYTTCINGIQIFDDISFQMSKENWICYANREWQVTGGLLYWACTALSIGEVKEQIRLVYPMAGIDFKGKYLRRRLINLVNERKKQYV